MDVLVEILKDPNRNSNRHTVAALIGLITSGADRHVAALQEFLESPGPGDQDVAAISLGYVVARVGHQGALDTLLLAEESTDTDRSEAAVLGLGVTGKEASVRRLEGHVKRAKKSGSDHASLCEEAIAASRKIAKVGLRGYYSSR